MNIFIQENGTRKPVEGGGNQDITSRIAVLENTVENLMQVLAQKLDTARVTQSTAVTEAGYAADARQMNAALPGTMAHEIKICNELCYENAIDLKNDTYCNTGKWEVFYAPSNGFISFCGVALENEQTGTARFVQGDVQIARQDFSASKMSGITFPVNQGNVHLYVHNFRNIEESKFKFIPTGN